MLLGTLRLMDEVRWVIQVKRLPRFGVWCQGGSGGWAWRGCSSAVRSWLDENRNLSWGMAASKVVVSRPVPGSAEPGAKEQNLPVAYPLGILFVP